MEIKVLCPCGAKFKFDVEPQNGKLPGPVFCPVCGAEGTEAGNRLIAEALAATTPANAPTRSGIVIPSVPRSSKDYAPPSTPSPGPAATAGVAPMRINAPAPAMAPVASSTSSASPDSSVSAPTRTATKLSVASIHTPAVAPEPAVAAAPQMAVPSPAMARPATRQKSREYSGPSNKRGIIGAAVGGFVGMLIWAGLIVATNTEIGWIAWGVGGLTGFAARGIGRGTGPTIGLAAAISAFVAIIGGQFLATRHAVTTFMDTMVKEGYDEHIAYAKEAAAAKNDSEIKAFLVKQAQLDEEEDAPVISDADVSDFKRDELPGLRKAANGQLSRAEFERTNRANLESVFTTRQILMSSLSFWTLLWIALGVGSAYKLGTGA